MHKTPFLSHKPTFQERWMNAFACHCKEDPSRFSSQLPLELSWSSQYWMRWNISSRAGIQRIESHSVTVGEGKLFPSDHIGNRLSNNAEMATLQCKPHLLFPISVGQKRGNLYESSYMFQISDLARWRRWIDIPVMRQKLKVDVYFRIQIDSSSLERAGPAVGLKAEILFRWYMVCCWVLWIRRRAWEACFLLSWEAAQHWLVNKHLPALHMSVRRFPFLQTCRWPQTKS